MRLQYKFLYTISINIEVYEDLVQRIQKIPYFAFKFEAGEENRIVYESLYWPEHVRFTLAGKEHQSLLLFTRLRFKGPRQTFDRRNFKLFSQCYFSFKSV